MAGDDAFGPCVADMLSAKVDESVRILDAGMQPGALLTELSKRERLIIVDTAVSMDGSPIPTLIDLDYLNDPLPLLRYDTALSTHGLGVADQLALARELGHLPTTVRLIAIGVEQFELGRDMSPRILAATHEAVSLILKWITVWKRELAN
jgi:hydrogenase maturation protease